MKFPLGAVIPGIIVIFLHCISAFEMMDYDKTMPDEEQDSDNLELYSITGTGLNGVVKRRLDSIAHNSGFSGFTDKRLYEVDDQIVGNSMAKRPFDSINQGPLHGFVKRPLAILEDNSRLNWFIQRPINLFGGMSSNMNMELPVDAIYAGGLNRPSVVPRRTRNLGYLNRWNLISNIRFNGFTKRADEVVDGELLAYRP